MKIYKYYCVDEEIEMQNMICPIVLWVPESDRNTTQIPLVYWLKWKVAISVAYLYTVYRWGGVVWNRLATFNQSLASYGFS